MGTGEEPPCDFEATIRILRPDQGGRKSVVFNGIRWDFAYANDEREAFELFMIHPNFLDEVGNSLCSSIPLPVDVELQAGMTILIEEMWSKVHQARIKEGVKFYCCEGSKFVAEGIVTKVCRKSDLR